MEYSGGCHCGTLEVWLRLSRPAGAMRIRSCACSFCRAHGTRTVADPAGEARISVADWGKVAKYRFGSGTADYMLCRQCGVYVGAVCATDAGMRAVINTRCLADGALFDQAAVRPDYDGETVADRLARRAANWMPVVVSPAGPG